MPGTEITVKLISNFHKYCFPLFGVLDKKSFRVLDRGTFSLNDFELQ